MSMFNVADAIIDVREIAPNIRHPLIFTTFDHLSPGEAFCIINDHDPKPLFYRLSADRPGMVSWQYLESGPDVWRIRISRSAV